MTLNGLGFKCDDVVWRSPHLRRVLSSFALFKSRVNNSRDVFYIHSTMWYRKEHDSAGHFEGVPLWKERCRLKLPPKPRYDVAVSLLWKDGRSSLDLMEPVLMAFGTHNLALELLSVQSRMTPALEEEEVSQCRSKKHEPSVGICVMSAAEQRMAAYSKSLQKSESTSK